MGQKRLKRPVIVIISALLLAAVLTAFLFMVRSPLLIVTDDEFTGLYGIWRTREKQIRTSLRLFRRVKAPRVGAGAPPDVVAFAVDTAAKKPFAVIFPYRYHEGARLYAAQAPEIPVIVQAGTARPGNSESSGLVYIETDKKTDFYRAGLCAAVFALRSDGIVLFIQGAGTTREDRTTFIQGLRQQGYENNPMFIQSTAEFQPNNNYACAVVAGAAVNFLNSNPAMPIIAFSWLDPAVTSQDVKLIFDDSLWALAARPEQVFGNPEPPPLPSEIIALKSRIRDEELWQDIQKIIRDKERYE
jgi:hypothetical protein